MSIEQTPDIQDEKRNADGTFKPGVSGNPAGRPKGSSLKEYMRRKFFAMSDEEKEAWLTENKITGDTLWKMAEGNPKQDTSVDITENEPDAIKLDE